MEENIRISNLNDFIFCPRSIYFHNLYSQFDEHIYHSTYQAEGNLVHKNIEAKNYSTKKSMLQGLDVFSEELGLVGKIDLYDYSNKELIERKKQIKRIYGGYYLQVYAQYFCLVEQGYHVRKITLRSLSDNRGYNVDLPGEHEKKKLFDVISRMKSFDLEDPSFSQNPKKCEMCIYKELCDYYKNDE